MNEYIHNLEKSLADCNELNVVMLRNRIDYKEKMRSFINKKFEEIASELTEIVVNNPRSFKCGNAVGYKRCLLDIERMINDDEL